MSGPRGGRAAVPAADVAAAVARLGVRWEALRGARVFVTGGTGFVGTWLVAALCAAEDAFALGLRVAVLTRDPAAATRRLAGLAGADALELIEGDVRDLPPHQGRVTHVVHGAADSAAALVAAHPDEVREVIVDGTLRVAELCRRRGVERVLALSSGAVYEPRRSPGRPFTEADALGPSEPGGDDHVYHRAKREMEALLQLGCGRAAVSLARLFAFVGPGLPVDRHFAVGDFVADALRGGPVLVEGDGTPVRTYLNAADLAAWLAAMLVDGRPGRAYNVGSERAVTIAEVAQLVAAVAGVGVEVRGRGVGAGGGGSWYVPDTRRARGELGVAEWTPLGEAIERWLSWERSGAR